MGLPPRPVVNPRHIRYRSALHPRQGRRIMTRTLTVTTLVISSLALLASGWTAYQQHVAQSPLRIIEARGLLIRDAQGQTRVVLGAPLPAPPNGAALRPNGLTGMVLLGPDGAERGGYGTADIGGEAMLTLDDARGTTEVFKVVASPDRGATLTLKHQNSAGAMLSSWQGAPALMFVDDGGHSYFVRPGANAAP